jgi:hypothetical protein
MAAGWVREPTTGQWSLPKYLYWEKNLLSSGLHLHPIDEAKVGGVPHELDYAKNLDFFWQNENYKSKCSAYLKKAKSKNNGNSAPMLSQKIEQVFREYPYKPINYGKPGDETLFAIPIVIDNFELYGAFEAECSDANIKSDHEWLNNIELFSSTLLPLCLLTPREHEKLSMNFVRHISHDISHQVSSIIEDLKNHRFTDIAAFKCASAMQRDIDGISKSYSINVGRNETKNKYNINISIIELFNTAKEALVIRNTGTTKADKISRMKIRVDGNETEIRTIESILSSALYKIIHNAIQHGHKYGKVIQARLISEKADIFTIEIANGIDSKLYDRLKKLIVKRGLQIVEEQLVPSLQGETNILVDPNYNLQGNQCPCFVARINIPMI